MEYHFIDWKKILDDRAGNGMRRSLKGATVTKRWKWRAWEALVGYTITDLRTHVESLFQAGMTWDNYGEWHLDHIVPKYFFRYASESDLMFKACWSLPNLTPIWGSENVAKGIGSFDLTVNSSLIQTLGRSLNTWLTTLFVLLALFLFGGVTITNFILILIIGITAGTYSSIFIASHLLVIWERKEWGRFLWLPSPVKGS